MPDRPAKMAIAALAAVAVTCTAVAVWLSWWAAGLFHEMDEFYRSSASNEAPDEVYRYYDTISRNSYAMQAVLGPLCAGIVFAIITAVAVLALRWERAEGKAL